MTDSSRLLDDLQAQVDLLQDDLRARSESEPGFARALRDEYAAAVRVHRTADTFETWREEPVTQAAVGWVLATVFVRFLEDNGLIDPRVSGAADRRRFALDQHAAYFERHPLETDREYLLHVFREVGTLPAARELFDEKHNALSRLTPSGDAAKGLLEFWQRIDPATGTIGHDLSDPSWNTRLLGDLYQDLSESARKRYALLQTPRFVEAFILDRTLTPAIETFGYREVTMIDPTCGSGHFLLRAFDRLLALYQANEPATNERERVQRVLGQIAGVDLNPFAAAIARFRLLVAALRACQIARLADAPAFDVNVGTGDSLLHGRRFAETGAVQMPLDPDDPSRHHFFAEDERVDRILGRQYHVVVGNPPYIVMRDRALNALYRARYGSCHRQYSLVVPFIERFFELAYRAKESFHAGYVGMIVANSFMKREFGSELIETYLKTIDLTHLIDTSGAYIPGHGTPTVILFGRNRPPGDVTRTVMGIRGEPSTPEDPARGRVWSAILAQVDVVASESDFVSVRDLAQADLHHHPWSIGGGGASELKEHLESRCGLTLSDIISDLGRTAHTGQDEAYFLRPNSIHTCGLGPSVPVVEGESVRDYQLDSDIHTVFPYEVITGTSVPATPRQARHFWPLRATLRSRRDFGHTPEERGLRWFDLSMFFRERYRSPLSIAFAFVATHNHFVLDRGGKVFKQTAPVIKLPAGASEDEHYALLGLLNSSTACFWLKQVCNCRGLGGQGGGIKPEDWHRAYEFASTIVAGLPIPSGIGRLSSLARRLDELAIRGPATAPRAVLAAVTDNLHERLATARADYEQLTLEMSASQESLDWLVYELYGLAGPALTVVADGLHALEPSMRPVEQLLQESIASGEPSIFYDVHEYRGTPRARVNERQGDTTPLFDSILANAELRLIETPSHKRRWQDEPWQRKQDGAVLEWLLQRLESREYWPLSQLVSIARLADVVRADAEFMRVAEVYRGRPDFDVTALVTGLVDAEAVPYLPVLRYTEAGLRKRAQWERTWELQRQEDAIDALVDLPDDDSRKLTSEQAATEKTRQVGAIPVPPKYSSADFKKGDYWRLRGKLDVPKERFIVYPGAGRSVDPTPVVAWAGWDHLQQAQALADYYVRVQEQDGWTAERLVPLLAGLLELVPWLKQWHNDLDPSFQVRMGDYFDSFVREQAMGLGVTVEQIRTWAPTAAAPRRRQATRRTAVQAPSN